MSCHDKQVILETHNRLRQMLALGQIRGQPPSLDMRELVGLTFYNLSNILNKSFYPSREGVGRRIGRHSPTVGRSVQRGTRPPQKNR